MLPIPAIQAAWSRRRVLSVMASAAALATPAFAQSPGWQPSRLVKIIVPFPAGGGTDILARYIAQRLGDKLGQAFIVENKPGATGTIGNQYVENAPPDGSVLLVGVSDNLSIAPHVLKSARTNMTKFVPISGLAFTPFVLLGRPDLPANNLQELLALMRKSSMSYASAGTGSSPHMMALAFARAASALRARATR